MIEFKNVTKHYVGTTAINDISLRVDEPGIYALLGKNGAGKTTFMKLLAGYIAASEGNVFVAGKRVTLGAMPEGVNFIESGAQQFNMRISSLIETAAGLQNGFDRDFAIEMIKLFDLNPRKRYRQLSFGMKTMLTTILTLANNSQVVLLDEPTLGFDAIVRNQFNTLLLESYQAHPRIIIVSTHLIDEIAKVVNRIIIINNGRILMETGIGEIDEMAYTLSGPTGVVMPLLSINGSKGLNCIGQTQMGSVMAAYIYDKRIVPPTGVSIDRISLEDFFVNLVGGKSHE
jgi:ABC-2 type transport system ATP-binding protein